MDQHGVLPTSASIVRDPSLNVAATYRRSIGASLERVWENVLDWEHLPWLHHDSFGSIELHEGGDWGWRARTTSRRDGIPSEIELLVDLEGGRYVSRVTEGEGEGQEIWTTLRVNAPRVTDIVVEFCSPVADPAMLEQIGASYLRLYTGLWDEDESMMRARQAALDRLTRTGDAPTADATLVLGSQADVRARLPFEVEYAGGSFRLTRVDGVIVAHAALCPHQLGPLGEGACKGGIVTCPWHGYAFDVRTGRSSDGRGLQLAPAPRVEIDPARDEVRLVSPDPPPG